MLGNYCDDETMAVMKGLPFLSPSDQQEASKYAKERKIAFISGRAKVPDYWQKALRQYDPNLAMRFDVDYDAFVVDYWIETEQYWHTVLIWRDENNRPLHLSETFIPLMLTVLSRNNLQQRYGSHKEYLAAKRAQAETRRRQNDAQRTEQVLEAVDSLSSKQIQQFIDVHRALHTGETIVTHGKDEKFLDMASENTKKVEAEGGKVVPENRELNPGMHPLIYNRPNR